MKKQLQFGLVVEGNSTSSAILRLPSLADELGPIKSAGLQVARRVSNFLRSGYAVTTYDELVAARIILLRVPDSSVGRIVRELSAANLPFEDLSFVLCETWLPTESLELLRERGASIATVVASPDEKNRTLAVEGDVTAVRPVRRLLERGYLRTLELRPGSKHLFFAAAMLTTAIPVPLLWAAQQALREGGLSGNQLATVLADMSHEMFSSFSKGARVTWGGPLTECPEESVRFYMERLQHSHPELAANLTDLTSWARSYMESQKLSRGHWA